MPTVKYSRQREAIKEYLMSTTSHPTADTVYQEIRKSYPQISLGTVYRNLSFLVEQGQIIKIDCGDNTEHYDGNVHPHNHLFCNKCHRLIDLDMQSIDLIDTIAAAGFGGRIDGHIVYFYGLCPECNE